MRPATCSVARFVRVRFAALVGLIALSGYGALAVAQERWAALSVIGDRMNVVFPKVTTGSRMNPVIVEPVMMKEDVLDRLALKALLDAAGSGKPEILPLALRDPRYYEAQDKLFASEGKSLLDGLLGALREHKVTHFLLIARWRSEASFKIQHGSTGIGQVEGLGFYVDRAKRLQLVESGEEAYGYLAPFTYYRLLLFDVTRSAVVGEERVTASSMFPVAGSQEVDPWQLVNPQRKVDELDRLLKEHMGPALARLKKSVAR